MSITVKQGDITKIRCDAVVNPANSFGYMGGGIAGALKRVGGEIIEKQAVRQAPIPVGTAIATTAGNLFCNYVIHAPTMERSAMKIQPENVARATRAALNLAKELQVKTVVLPGMGTGVGNVSETDAARVMFDVVKDFRHFFDKIVLIDRNKSMVLAFQNCLQK